MISTEQRAVRRYERLADAVMADLDRRHEERMRNLEIARAEMKTSMHEKTDRFIAEMTAKAAPRMRELAELNGTPAVHVNGSPGTIPALPPEPTRDS